VLGLLPFGVATTRTTREEGRGGGLPGRREEHKHVFRVCLVVRVTLTSLSHQRHAELGDVEVRFCQCLVSHVC
jgi:hypothetical protein